MVNLNLLFWERSSKFVKYIVSKARDKIWIGLFLHLVRIISFCRSTLSFETFDDDAFCKAPVFAKSNYETIRLIIM